MRLKHIPLLVFILVVLIFINPIAYASDSVRYGAVNQGILQPDPNNPAAEFGTALAVHNDTLVVGARHDNTTIGSSTTYYTGAVYVYTLEKNIWVLQARLVPTDVQAGDLFGASVDLYADTLVVGAVGVDGVNDEADVLADIGSVYVFTRSGDFWQQQAKILPPDPQEDENFGGVVALAGNRLVVSAASKDTDNSQNAGQVYSFYRSGAQWYPSQSIKPDLGRDAAFGAALDYDGQRLVVGAPGENSAGTAYIYYRVGNTWQAEARLEPDGDQNLDGSYFGAAVALDGQRVVVGAPFADSDNGYGGVTNAGMAYVYRKTGHIWQQEVVLSLAAPSAFDQFGAAVAVEGATIVVGADGSDYFGIFRAGTAHIFVRSAGEWQLQSRVVSSAPSADGGFGADLDLLDDQIFVGEPAVNTISQAGFVHIYALEEGVLPETGYPASIGEAAVPQAQPGGASSGLQIEIPELGLETDIVSALRQGNSWDVAWLLNNVGHLEGSAYPTLVGNTVIAGHVNLPDGSPGPFAALHQLQWGDKIVISRAGYDYIYEVRARYTTTPDDLGVLTDAVNYDWLTLITCRQYSEALGQFTQREIVVAVRVE